MEVKVDTKMIKTVKVTLVLLISMFILTSRNNVDAQGLALSNGVDLIRGAWGGTINLPNKDVQINLYFNEFVPDPKDPGNNNVAVSSGFLSFSPPGKQKRAKALMTPMQARYTDLENGNFDVVVVGTLLNAEGTQIIRLTGEIQTFGSGVVDDIVFNGVWHIGDDTGDWAAEHLDRQKIKTPEIVLDDVLFFNVDINCGLIGPAGDPQTRNPVTMLGAMTNIVIANVRVDIPDDGFVIIPPFTDVFSPDVDFINSFRFLDIIGGLPVVGESYTFTALDIVGNPIAGVLSTDIYVGANEPDPPINVNANVIGNGIFVTWDPVAEIPGSFEPEANPPLGFYQIELRQIAGGEILFGANLIQSTSHLIPSSKADFGVNDFGRSLDELDNGTYIFDVISFSIAPIGSAGKGLECQSREPAESIIFEIDNGTIILNQ
jgi:hypothetical protein